MIQKLYSTKIKKTIRRSLSVIEGIMPFTQKPSKDQFTHKGEAAIDEEISNEDDDVKAADLFSFFTADIINEEIIFTR